SSSPGPTWILSIAFFWASLTAWAQASRLITAPPKAVAATAAPVAALAPRKPRRLRPLASGLAGGLLILSLMLKLLVGTLGGRWSGFYYVLSRNQLRIRRFLASCLALVLQDQRRTLVLVVVGHLAIEAVMALVVVDMAVRVDGLDLAFLGAQLAGVAAFLAALEPVEQAHPAGHRQGGAQRAEVTAEHLAGEDIDHQQDHRVEHEPPLAVELEHDGGLERLYLGGLLGQHHRFQRDAEQYQQDDVLDGPQPLVHREGQLVLGYFQLAGDFVDQLLQRTEGAQPAAEHAPTPEQDAGGGEGPEDEDHRIAEEQFPAELGYQGMHEGQHVDHRQ